MLDTNFVRLPTKNFQPLPHNTGYKIGAVSRITGIGSETIRAW